MRINHIITINHLQIGRYFDERLSLVYGSKTTTSIWETFLQDFSEILKWMLQNFLQILEEMFILYYMSIDICDRFTILLSTV